MYWHGWYNSSAPVQDSLWRAYSMNQWKTHCAYLISWGTCTGLKAGPRDYSLKGTKADRTFNAIGALATIAFAYNTGILPEMQVVPHLDDAIFFLLWAAWQEYMSIWKCLSVYCWRYGRILTQVWHCRQQLDSQQQQTSIRLLECSSQLEPSLS